MINIDITIFIQLANFLITLVVLNFLLIKPIRDIVKKRRDIASGFLNDTETFAAEAAKHLNDYEAALARAREEASTARDVTKAEAMQQEAAIIAKTQLDVQEYIGKTREQTKKTVADAMKTLQKQIPALADKATNKLLGAKSKAAS